jgi:hypothetical protein
MDIMQQKLINDILKDNAQTEREINQSVSSLTASSEKAIHMAAYLCTDAQLTGSVISKEYLLNVSEKLTSQREQLNNVVSVLNELKSLLDPVTGINSAALSSLIINHNCDPSTFTKRYN